MARRRKDLPPGARRTSAGNITITIPVEIDGERTRLAHSKVKPDEPQTYADSDQAWQGYYRVIEYRDQKRADGQTVREFWEKWIDPDHIWNRIANRSEGTLSTYVSATHRFVTMFENRPMDAISTADIERYVEKTHAAWTVPTISTLFADAEKRGLVRRHPCRDLANDIDKAIKAEREDKRQDPPNRQTVQIMLDRLLEPPFPRSLYGWFCVGVYTGMRGGEIDGMEWEYLDGNLYRIRRQWNERVGKMTGPKHGSKRDLLLPPVVMEAIEMQANIGSPYIFVNTQGSHWSHDARQNWWQWCSDGEPSPRQIVGGVTMYNATRHHWASWAVNEGGMSPYQASLLYGHKDGGKLITETYAKPNHNLAMQASLDALARYEAAQTPVDLTAERRRRRAA